MKIIIALLVVLNLNVYGQHEGIQNKTNGNEKIEKRNTPQTATDEIKFKNETGNAIITITDEGNNAGSILLPSVGGLLTGSKLYSNGVNLFWGNSQLNGSNGATVINDLSDAKYGGSSLFLGELAGANDGEDNHNLGFGYGALHFNTTGENNVAIGELALVDNLTGDDNIAIGFGALLNNTGGSGNIAIGLNAINSNSTGSDNTAIGAYALRSNTTGNGNTANGFKALHNNTEGFSNTAIGINVLYSNTTGANNTAMGKTSLFTNTEGSSNTATGISALYSNTIGDDNAAVGFRALYNNTEGNKNTAIGVFALNHNATGAQNTATGHESLYKNYGDYNTAIGYRSLFSNTSGSNNTGIGNKAEVPNAGGSNQVRIGNTQVSYAGVQVAWSVTSDKRWKEQIRSLPYGLDIVMQLNPVDYFRKNSNVQTREIGFIAQDVEELLTKSNYDDQGFLTKGDEGHLNLRYNDFIPLLTKAMQEQQDLIKKLENRIEELEKKN